MGSSPGVSVIVPFYNAAPYLRDCIESLQRQTLADLEILLVNDGSTDDSLTVARSSATADRRITVLEQGHTGPGAARNRGMSVARSTYLMFVDSDDQVTANSCEAMLQRAEASRADLVLARADHWTGPVLPPECVGQPVAAVKGLYSGRLSMGVYAKMYRREFLRLHHIGFPPSAFIEDRHFLLQCLVADPRLASLDQVVYRRRDRADSTMRQVGPKHARDATAIYQLDAALLARANLLRSCGVYGAWATLHVDLYLARARSPERASLLPALRAELDRQETLFRDLQTSVLRHACLLAATRQLRRDLAHPGSRYAVTRTWLRLLRAILR